MHMRKDHRRFLFSMFGPMRPYKCNKCERSLDKDPSQDTHTCLPSYVPSRKGNHVTEDDLKCHQCNKVCKLCMHTVRATYIIHIHSLQKFFTPQALYGVKLYPNYTQCI